MTHLYCELIQFAAENFHIKNSFQKSDLLEYFADDGNVLYLFNEAEAENVSSDDIIKKIFETVPVP